jgi:DNA invertase Pin-like site-specific DNA recombinase
MKPGRTIDLEEHLFEIRAASAEEPYLIGYARVSKGDEQSNASQLAVLSGHGCRRIFHETASSGRWDRPELQAMLSHLRAGDVVVVWRLERLTGNLVDLLTIMKRIHEAGAGFRSLTEAIDTTTAGGVMMMQMLGAVAQFRLASLRENTQRGLRHARSEGRIGGRRKALTVAKELDVVKRVLSGEKSAADMARLYDVSPSTISRILERHRPL